MAQTNQQVQNKKVTVKNVHFRWMGSNAPIASLKANHSFLFYCSTLFNQDEQFDDFYLLRKWLAPKLGLRTKNWFQVTLFFGEKRLTHDVLLGSHLFNGTDGGYRRSLMPHIGEACQSFVTQLRQKTTADIVVHVTRCSDADCDAPLLLVRDWRPAFYSHLLFDNAVELQQKNNTVADALDKYCNNVAFMTNVMVMKIDAFVSHASLKIQQNELLATAGLKISYKNAALMSPVLWNKPDFVLKAAALDVADLSKYLGPDVRNDPATMLRLIKMDSRYFDAATLKTDFEFQCLAVSANPDVLYKLDKLTQTKVNERNCNLSIEKQSLVC